MNFTIFNKISNIFLNYNYFKFYTILVNAVKINQNLKITVLASVSIIDHKLSGKKNFNFHNV